MRPLGFECRPIAAASFEKIRASTPESAAASRATERRVGFVYQPQQSVQAFESRFSIFSKVRFADPTQRSRKFLKATTFMPAIVREALARNVLPVPIGPEIRFPSALLRCCLRESCRRRR